MEMTLSLHTHNIDGRYLWFREHIMMDIYYLELWTYTYISTTIRAYSSTLYSGHDTLYSGYYDPTRCYIIIWIIWIFPSTSLFISEYTILHIHTWNWISIFIGYSPIPIQTVTSCRDDDDIFDGFCLAFIDFFSC